MKTNLVWQDDGSFSYAWFSIFKLSVEYEGAMHPRGSDLPTGFRVSLVGYRDRQLKNLFVGQENAKIAAERLLWKVVNEMYQEISLMTWDTHNKLEIKQVER